MALFGRLRADALHEQAQNLEGVDDDAALQLYQRALELEPARPNTLYNIGLIHKYRREWPQSLAYNRRALVLRSDDEAIRWNLGIAATALGDWATAREVWALCGYDVGEGEGPIQNDFGEACARLNPDGEAEVVWIRRIDPVRGRILNVPFQESGYYFGDIVLHDGAPTGSKIADDQEYSIFNAFQRCERSVFGTAVAHLQAPSEMDVAALCAALDDAGVYAEDWTANTQFLCKQCSEGVTHVGHDTELSVWQPAREMGIAVQDEAVLDAVLKHWTEGAGRGVGEVMTVR